VTNKLQEAHFIFGPRAISAPIGVFLLVRKGREFGAICFKSIEPSEKINMGKSKFESYFQGDGSGLFIRKSVISVTGELNTKPLTGIGRFSFGGGNRKLKVGNWSFSYNYPTWISMWPYGNEEGDYGFEFSPTSAKNIADIDVFDSHLKWYKYDSHSSIKISIKELGK